MFYAFLRFSNKQVTAGWQAGAYQKVSLQASLEGPSVFCRHLNENVSGQNYLSLCHYFFRTNILKTLSNILIEQQGGERGEAWEALTTPRPDCKLGFSQSLITIQENIIKTL